MTTTIHPPGIPGLPMAASGNPMPLCLNASIPPGQPGSPRGRNGHAHHGASIGSIPDLNGQDQTPRKCGSVNRRLQRADIRHAKRVYMRSVVPVLIAQPLRTLYVQDRPKRPTPRIHG
jgi:hypothetical protein